MASRSSAKTRLSFGTGRLWARRAPSGAVETLATTIPASAGRKTNPSVCGGRSGAPSPLMTYPALPASAIGSPIAAEVPIARCTGTLHQAMKGTERVPPPMPTRLETTPIPPPTALVPAAAGDIARRARPSVQKHLHCHEIEEDHEKPLEKGRREPGGDPGAAERPRQDPGRDPPDDGPVDRAAPVVRPQARDRREDDAGHRGAERQVHQARRRQSLSGEGDDQQRHDDQPAADAEQAGEHTGVAPMPRYTRAIANRRPPTPGAAGRRRANRSLP